MQLWKVFDVVCNGEYPKSLFGILPIDADMDYIITRNVKDYQNGIVKAILPDDFITLMEESAL